MARITVEDCLQKIPNRFQMILVAAYRARKLAAGHESPLAEFIDPREKRTVTALREIAKGLVGVDMLKRIP